MKSGWILANFVAKYVAKNNILQAGFEDNFADFGGDYAKYDIIGL